MPKANSPPLHGSARQLVRAAFNRAATRYDAASTLQKEVCALLLAGLDASGLGAYPAILDAGCGTGYGARLLRSEFSGAHLTLADFAPAMLEQAKNSANICCVADIHALPFANSSFDLWWSSLVIQWCNTGAVFTEAARVLRSGGYLAVSTLGEHTFAELRTAFSALDPYRHTLDFATETLIYAAIQQAQCTDIALHRTTITQHYPDLKSLLHSVKAIGANTVVVGGRSALMGRKGWQALEAAFEKQRTPEGLPLSYDVIWGYAKRC